ncbi:MAG TPA: PEP-CTERM sorting domain-containing protein [Phycisphaerae bacterium]|mgnify:FL=1|nr:PEP-CTERM sorting domain-containing protein [Phycisphaerae bacterium]HRR85881.1 PEP-CTERM sorting domain-containing protein [Phycisphaerae bacterium]
MKIDEKNVHAFSIAALIIAVGSQMSLAQGVGNLGSLPTLFLSPAPITGWSVDSGNATSPWLPVQIDPNGPQWGKTFTGLNGQPIVAVPGQTFTLQELLVVAPTQSWEDWHEHILTPGWEWVQPTVFLANFAPPPGLNTVVTPATPTSGGKIDFTFNPLVPGTLIDIRKTLKYDDPTGAVFTGKIEIAQFPTPEPATLGLLMLGGLLALRRRRHAA